MQVFALKFGLYCKKLLHLHHRNKQVQQIKKQKMAAIRFEKLQRVEAPQDDKEYKEKGIMAFQLVVYHIDFYGVEISNTLDTVIYKDGTQKIIAGDGWVKCGTIVK